GLETVVTASTTKRRVTGFVESMIPDGEAAVFTQALFDLGATVCRPRDPECKACPLSAGCLAFRDGRQAELPVLAARPKPLTRTVAVALVRSERGVLFRRRSDQASRMPGFWEMPEVWCASRDEAPAALEEHLRLALSRAIGPGREVAAVRHTITKYRLDCRLFAVAIEGSLPSLGDEWSWSASPDALPGPTSTISRKLWSTHEMAATDCGGKPVRRAPRR
ncbi:MAG: hypothetical protein KDB53_19390, partial [Planctomycetes bacterium]|nr:hypothetical protein [Planctomycetota bacterium]